MAFAKIVEFIGSCGLENEPSLVLARILLKIPWHRCRFDGQASQVTRLK